MTMTQQEIESYLWEQPTCSEARIIGYQKSIIFPLMFFKGSSYVYDEEYEQALVTFGDEESAKFVRIIYSKFLIVRTGKT